MKNLSMLLIFSYIMIFQLVGYASTEVLKKDYMLEDLDFIRNTFNISYAPAEWKKNYSGWDLDREISIARQKVLETENISIKDFQKIVKKFFLSTKDYHVGVMFYSTESANLPFRVKGTNGRYFFSYIDYSKLSPDVFPFRIGDELVNFDGRPTDEAVRDIKEREIGNANEKTDLATAQMFLTTRIGMYGHEVPTGPVTITVRPSGTNILNNYQLIWNYTPEKVTNSFSTTNVVKQSSKAIVKNPKISDNPIFKKLLLNPIFEQYTKVIGETKLSNDTVGAKKSFIPELGNIIWKSDFDQNLYAYLFETENRDLIGYIRIPDYLGGQEAFVEFLQIIDFFQTRSDALIIDQINNPGGSAFHTYALASTLTDQPLQTPKHRMSINQSDVFNAVLFMPIFESVESDQEAQELLGKTLEGIPVTYQMVKFLQNYFNFIVDEWNSGRTLTQPFYLYGVDHINPNPFIQYTKPILVIVNELDFSGGDFFPAIMQDNKRATIFGTRTAGAGGYVTHATSSNLNGIAYFHYTGSLAERVDNNPIENLGVTPDVQYEITTDDLEFGYHGYRQAILQELNNILNQK